MDLNIQENVKCLAIKECFSGSENEDLYISTETGVSYYRHVTCMAQIHRKFIQSIRLSHVQNFLAVYHKNGVLSVFDDKIYDNINNDMSILKKESYDKLDDIYKINDNNDNLSLSKKS